MKSADKIIDDLLWNRNRTLAYRLKLLRKEQRMTQEQVAACLSIQRSTYAYYETGRTMPKLRNLVKMSELFGVTTDYLIGKSERRGEPEG